jgi:hypothetical protein
VSDEVTTPPPATAPAGGPATAPPPAAPPAPEPAAAPAEPSKAKKIRNRILRVVAVPVIVIVGGIVWAFASGDPTLAKTGDCLVGDNADDIKIVGCDDATAQWKVVGEVADVKEAAFNASENDTSCTAYPTAEASFWSGKEGGNGDVLCLEPVKK